MTNLKPFNLQEALAGKPCVTRDGRKVKELFFFKNTTHNFPVMVCAEDNGIDSIYIIRKDGTYSDSEHFNDLFMAPTKKKIMDRN